MRIRFASSSLGLLVILATGCASAPDVQLRNQLSGQTFTCEGDNSGWEIAQLWGGDTKRQSRDACVEQLEQQGYVIVK